MNEEYEAKLIDARSVVYMSAWAVGCAGAISWLSPTTPFQLFVLVMVYVVGLAVVAAVAMAMGEREHTKSMEAGGDHEVVDEVVEA